MALARTSVDTHTEPQLAFPIIIDRRSSATSVAVAASFIVLAALILLTPFSLLAAGAAHDPTSFLNAVQQPAVAVQLGLALIVALTFVSMPLRKLVNRSRLPARIVVTADAVLASTGADGASIWCEPLAAYHGVAHHIRTSLSGTEHEIVLVHAEPSKSVVLKSADRIAQPQLDAVSVLLGVPQVPARTLYQGRGQRSMRPLVSTPELSAA